MKIFYERIYKINPNVAFVSKRNKLAVANATVVAI